MLEQIRKQIERLKEAKAWLQTHLNADEMIFRQLFPDVLEMISEKKQEEIRPTQLIKEAPSSFVNFN